MSRFYHFQFDLDKLTVTRFAHVVTRKKMRLVSLVVFNVFSHIFMHSDQVDRLAKMFLVW